MSGMHDTRKHVFFACPKAKPQVNEIKKI